MTKTEKYQSFEEFIKQVEDPNSAYLWAAKDLPEKPTVLEKAKFAICQKILTYQQVNNLSDKRISQQLQLTKKKTLKLLFCWIDDFTLDGLVNMWVRCSSLIRAKSRVLQP